MTAGLRAGERGSSRQSTWLYRSPVAGEVVHEKSPYTPMAAMSAAGGYFEAIGARILTGRAFTPRDGADRPGACAGASWQSD